PSHPADPRTVLVVRGRWPRLFPPLLRLLFHRAQGASMTILTPTSGGSITGADGTVWTMDAAGDGIMNGTDVPGGAGTGALTVVGSQAWGLDSTSGIWYIWNGANWISQSGPPPVV